MIHMIYQALLSSEINKDVTKYVVFLNRDWRAKD